MAKQDDDIVAYDRANPAGAKKFPAKPGFIDQVKEAFEPTDTRIMLEQIRKRRQSAR